MSWHPLNHGTSNKVFDLIVFDDGGGSALFAGGSMLSASGVPVRGIGRWKNESWQALRGAPNATVNALTVLDDGHGYALYAGGSFTQAGERGGEPDAGRQGGLAVLDRAG